MDSLTRLLMQGAAGGAAAAGLGIEDVFSTYLYSGNGSTQTITNDIDLSGEGGMVWLKQRNTVREHYVFDTQRGAGNSLWINTTAQNGGGSTDLSTLSSFNSAGFTLGNSGNVNQSSGTYASWTFRKAPGFFDVVTWTGDGTSNRQISHNLGSTPGMIIIKRLNSTSPWTVIHRSLSSITNNYIYLNEANPQSTGAYLSGWDSSSFTLGTYNNVYVNGSGDTYVAYLFAHDEQIFGKNADQSVIKCGSYTGTGAAGNFVNIGWEPQWLMIKPTQNSGGWMIFDNMRGVATGGNDNRLEANVADAEVTFADTVDFNSTGFTLTSTSSNSNTSGNSYIYVAIRRGPMKTPTDATTVFTQLTRTGNGVDRTITGIGFPQDMILTANRSYAGDWKATFDRLRGNLNWLQTTSTAVEGGSSSTEGFEFDNTTGTSFLDHINNLNRSGQTYIDYFFRRAPGFFDVVAYTGTGVARTVNHNLGVAPELIITKARTQSAPWYVDYVSLNLQGNLNSNIFFSSGLIWDNGVSSSGISTTLTVPGVNQSNDRYIAYLFATVSGVSKVGSYTGTASTLNIDCGFSAGARFVLIKRTDNTGDWYVWDTARGITAGNDPYLLLNSTAAEVTGTDYIDSYSPGFTITSTAPAAINASGGSFIFFAVA